ncbi:hypothetical protein [Duganella violaceipulchra]|uniref:Uncharacterized protein n=1 Tax=Duganella violaceipulchra TaxID=2849652 RepID=A0AA41H3D2_9BURK|nr:hypothetical protein [Duganella violaceicalia]MBV6320028.1 hypothetical protein [Duganella violaceicalia]MCP2010392.1 hypothetical protein [Duganella violaceicalia]
MNAARTCELPPAAHAELENFLRNSGSTLSPVEATIIAIREWIEKCRAAAAPMRGYQWKQLFIPEKSRLRMSYAGMAYYAEVVGEEILFRDDAVSPRQMTMQIAGDGRNAWRDLWILLPGEKNWANAARLRDRLQQRAAKQPLSAADAMTVAAKSMSDALTTALALVEHANHQSQNTLERRLPRYRRQYDLLSDDH